jgi:predicted permease
MYNFGRDLRYALRILGKNPGFGLMAIVALALGIGANTAIFTVVYNILLRPLAYVEPERLVVALHGGTSPVSPADFLDYRRETSAFEQLAAAQYWSGNLAGRDKPESILGLQVTANLLPMLGVPPLLGRTFTAQDEKPGAPLVLVIGYPLWQRHFGGDPGVVGRTVNLDGQPFTIAGVMPASFQFAPFWATQAEMWTPLSSVFGARLNDRGGRSLRVFGRLRKGVSVSQAQAQMDAVALRLAERYPATNAKLGIQVVPLQEKVVGALRPTLLILFGAVVFVLFIACANVANLMLTRAIARRKEIAVRIAIGASRRRLASQLLTESLLLAVLGGICGLALANWGVHGLSAILPAGKLPRQQEVGFDGVTFLFAFLVTLLAGVASGLAPAWQFSRSDIHGALKEGTARRRTRGTLVACEVALSLILLVGAGLMLRTLLHLQSVDPGFQLHRLLTMTVSVGGTAYDSAERRPVLFQQVRDALAEMGGIQSVSTINHLPIGGDLWRLGYTIVGRPAPPPGDDWGAVYRVTSPGYFGTMGMRLQHGRDFSAHDNAGSPLVAIVNESMARRRWPDGGVIGRTIVYADGHVRSIVGVVQDARQSDWTSPIDDEVYLPYLQNSQSTGTYLTFVVRTAAEPEKLIAAIQKRIWAIDKDLPVSLIMTMEQVMASNLWRFRLTMMLLGIFAGIALLLAAVGIYGVIAYSVRSRVQEIGIRMALGAQRSDVLKLTMSAGMRPVFAGASAGLLLAAGMSRWMSSLLYGVRAIDPFTYAGVTGALLLIAFLANYFPARRAMGVDPLVALRHE